MLLFLLTSSNLFAQVVGTQPSPNATYNQTSNLLNPTVNAWTGTVAGQNGGFSGGTTPAFNAGTNTIIFGYTTATAAQTIAINQALSGTGIQVGGYNYSWNINNDPATMQYGTLTGKVVLKDSGGNALQTYNYNYPQQAGGFITYSGTQWFTQNYSLSGLSNLELSFTGKDATFWAGYYGPQVRNPSLSLQYTFDPCTTNPGYSPSCPGYNAITSGNLLPGTTGTQAYAIASALSLAGAGATIHGFDYGYSYNVAGRNCAILDLFGFCLTGWNYSDAGVATVITDSNNATLHSNTTTHNGGNNGVSGNYSTSFRLSSSLPMSSLGAFAMSPWINGTATINNMWSNAVYSPDPCVANPLSSQSCSGYAAAYLTQQCTLNALYDPSCPGYQTAQCNINPLYAQTCPGYQAAYYAQQCTLNALYDTGCPGYQQAYYNQQCSANPLYHTGCPGYQQAYKTQQCNLNGLYATDCPNYAEAYAKKNVLGIDTTGTSTTTTKTSSNTPSKTEASTTISNDGKVKTEVSKTGDSAVDSVIESKTTSTTADATAAVQLAPSGGRQDVNTNINAQANEQTKQTSKTESKTTASSSERQQSAAVASRAESRTERTERADSKSGSNEGKSSGEMKQAAQQRAEQEMKKAENAATFEAQIAVQTNVIGAMGFVPGFTSYAQSNVPDILQRQLQRQYAKDVVDNRMVGRRLFSGSDRLHEEMVNEQYRK